MASHSTSIELGGGEDYGGDYETLLTDVLADVMHFALSKGIDMPLMVEKVLRYVAMEVEEE